jgi:hypothetical protein
VIEARPLGRPFQRADTGVCPYTTIINRILPPCLFLGLAVFILQ